jgi:hypothetical protein
MNTYAVKPLDPFVPVFHVKASCASEALEKALAIHVVHGIWQVKTQPIN